MRAEGEHGSARPSAPTGLLDFGDVAGLRALRSVNDLELHCLTFLERPESIALNGRVVHEDIAASVALDETVPLGVVEPLDLACDAHRSSSYVLVTLYCVGTEGNPKKKAAALRPFPSGARPARRPVDNTGLPPLCQEPC